MMSPYATASSCGIINCGENQLFQYYPRKIKFLDLQGECPCVQYSPGFLFYVSYLERWKIGTAICCCKW